MFESFAQIFPAEWQGAVMLLVAPLRWLAGWQHTVAQLFVSSGNPLVISLLVAGLALPGVVFSAAIFPCAHSRRSPGAGCVASHVGTLPPPSVALTRSSVSKTSTIGRGSYPAWTR